MSNSAMHPSRGRVGICYAERDVRKEVSIFVTLAPNLTEPIRVLRNSRSRASVPASSNPVRRL
jgi:hypothetical protein